MEIAKTCFIFKTTPVWSKCQRQVFKTKDNMYILYRFPHIDILQYFEFLGFVWASVNEPSIYLIHRAVVCQTLTIIKYSANDVMILSITHIVKLIDSIVAYVALAQKYVLAKSQFY